MATQKSKSEDDAEQEKCAKNLNCTADWGNEAKNGQHLWCRTSSSGDLCYVSNDLCADRGSRVKCSSCKIIVHSECISILVGRMRITCRSTFQDADIGSYRENTVIKHHYIARRTEKGRCRTCSKSFGGKVKSLLNETVAMSCSWCKDMCHSKESCFSMKKMAEENCKLGTHANLIVPPTWIVKLAGEETENSKQVFALKPIPSSSSKPLLVFINPKSGGNQGSKLMRSFQWLLNPRQVFDLTDGGPGFGLELYRRVPNLRILACGGDGTVGWILSILDDLKITPSPPIAVLPLGTGNDLARALGWGGGYTDEPLSKILSNVEEGEIIKLDRWILKINPNTNADLVNCEEGKKSLSLNVVNNYFSLGVDALIALEFHEAREARPGKFNSRLRNKIFYGQAGGKDLIQRKWKDLSSFVKLECDGQDMTAKLRELKVHSILFLNISSYGGGTKPWGTSGGGQFRVPSTEDGMIEVIGLTTYQLPLLQAGGHGTPIAQCKRAKLCTSRTVPVQVDGEPCRLSPSIIEIDLLNTVNMIAKTKRHGVTLKEENVEKINLPVKRLSLLKYETEHHHKDSLKDKASDLGTLSISFDTELSKIRSEVTSLLRQKDPKTEEGEEKTTKQGDMNEIHGVIDQKITDWWFLDSCSANKFFRIDQAQEHLYYVNDICDQELFIAEQREQIDDATNDVIKEAEPDDDDVSRASTSSSSRQSQGSEDYREILERIAEETESEEWDMMTAAKMGCVEQVARHHSKGHDLMERDNEGRTALHHAAFIGNINVVRYLATYAPISVLDAQDDVMYQTALHRAALRRDKITCSILVSAGAALDIKDKQGCTAQQLAEMVGDKVLAAYLENMNNPVNL